MIKVYAALPAMNEPDVEQTIRQILAQTVPPEALYVCVNQPESFKNDPEKRAIYEQNQQTLIALARYHEPKLHIIDKSTIGWDEKNHGVGWARKTLFDTIDKVAQAQDIIISLDADTEYPPTYFESVVQLFKQNPDALALSNPYYHRLTGQEDIDRAMLRYEIYARCYYLNLVRIGSPYAFTALGSAIAVRVDACRKIGGLSPKKSGEDFYFLQQLCKTGKVLSRNSVVVYPATRLSNRVFFGTGPALIKGLNGDWDSYPIYSPKLWDEVAQIREHFEDYFSPEDLQKLRSNSKTPAQFRKFCEEKFDGLRTLQYLKCRNAENPVSDEVGLRECLDVFGISINLPSNFSFQTASVSFLNEIRDSLFVGVL